MRRLIRYFAFLSLLAGWASCAATAPEKTRASPKTQADVMEMIQVIEPALGSSCDERELVKTEVVKRASAEDYSAVERWTIDRCGKLVPYLVTFRPGLNGGIEFSVRAER
jgi:hypothetical protein